MFFEARGEGLGGWEAVAKNVLYRTHIKYRGAESVCQTIGKRSQYSYRWDNTPDVILESELDEWADIKEMAGTMLASFYHDQNNFDYQIGNCQGASHYHASWIDEPYWVPTMKYCGQVGQHHYYLGN